MKLTRTVVVQLPCDYVPPPPQPDGEPGNCVAAETDVQTNAAVICLPLAPTPSDAFSVYFAAAAAVLVVGSLFLEGAC